MARKLPPNPMQSEILQAVSSAKTKREKIDLLREYRNPALVSLLIWNFDDVIKSAVPDGDVPYKPNDNTVPDGLSRLSSSYRTFYNFIESGNREISRTRSCLLYTSDTADE